MAEAIFRPPSPLELTSSDGDLAQKFKDWKRELMVYMDASGGSSKSKKVQTAIILNIGGSELLKTVDQLDFEKEEDREDPTKVLKVLEEYCNSQQNEVLQTFKFWNIAYKEPFDSFLTELRRKAEGCNFLEKERMIRDKIVFSVNKKLQQKLLRESKLDLKKTLSICRAFEASTSHANEMKATNSEQSIDKVQRSTAHGSKEADKPQVQDCHFCGGNHVRSKFKCPAWGATCENCNGRNHFKKKCKKLPSVKSIGREKTDEDVQERDNDEFLGISTLQANYAKKVTAVMNVNKQSVRFQLDSGADVNTICKRYVHKNQLQGTKDKLIMWNGSTMKPLGEAHLDVTNPRTDEISQVRFVVVENNFTCLLGLRSVQEMGLMTVNHEKFIASVCKASNDLGNLGEATLTTDPEIPTKALPSRNIPLALKDDVKKELEKLVTRGILVPIQEPTKWVSQMAVVRKGNGSLRICIDPQPLNKALMREHYRLPTLDDILPQLDKAKFFTKLDIKEAFWHIELDTESSKLTTMITPFGRYRWARLPFGLKISSEIFQRRLHEAIGDLPGVICVADDIVVTGCGDTEDQAEKDHDHKLDALKQRCKQKNIKLNDAKTVLKQKEITFLGHTISASGMKAHEGKVQAIREMPVPNDAQGVKRFCGMVQYMARFLPDLSIILRPLRELTKQGAEWKWSEECAHAFETIKSNLMKAPVLAYFSPDKQIVLQVDSSKDGLGVVLLQDGKPIEYASRSLTPAEQNWAQIEKEALAVVYGLERFDQYTYGRTVVVQNDHKPLFSILRKPLSQAPKRLQALMLRLYRYDVDFHWLAGKDLVIADTLSRAYTECPGDIVRIMNIDILPDIPDKLLETVKQETKQDEVMVALWETIQTGWPEKKASVTAALRPYYDIRDTLSGQNGVLVKGQRIIVPKAMRKDMLRKLHAAHLGYDSMVRRAKEVLFWPGMRNDIKQVADTCEACQERKPKNQKETLRPISDGEYPWDRIGLDIFEIERKSYLVIVDYFSGYIETEYLSTTTSKQVITKLKTHCARYGIPRSIISDNGTQFTSHEFRDFSNKWAIKHMFSSPHHQQANGRAEAAVKTMKNMMLKCLRDRRDPYEALMELRNTPRQDTGQSPAQVLFGRNIRTLIPAISNHRTHKNTEKRAQRRQTTKKSYDKTARDMPPLHVGNSIYFKRNPEKNWERGQIKMKLGERAYVIKSGSKCYRRNRIHIRGAPQRQSDPEDNVTSGDEDSDDDSGDNDEDEAPVIEAAPPRRSQRIRRQPVWMQDYVAN